MVTAALDALVGTDPGDETVAAAMTTIPADELPAALQLLVREHGRASLPLLRRCLAGRPEWVSAAAAALARLPIPEAAACLAAVEGALPTRTARTAVRRALYRLRQAGVTPPAPAPASRRPPAAPVPRQAWVSAIDGTGARGCWVVLEGPYGERTLLAAVVSDTAGVLDFAAGPIAKKRLAERLRALRDESPLPWVEVPAAWGAWLLAEAGRRHDAAGAPSEEAARWLGVLPAPPSPPASPIHSRLPGELALDAEEGAAELLAVPELAGWFLDPSTVGSEAVALLESRESRLIVSDQIKAERQAALVDRVIEAQFDAATRHRWARRLEETAFVLAETGRLREAGCAVATARALDGAGGPPWRLTFIRALVERSLEVAGEVALGRLPAAEVSRAPR